MHANPVEKYLQGVLHTPNRREAVRELANRVGQGNRGKLCRRLHGLFETGSGPSELIDRVRIALADEQRPGFDAALRETRLQARALKQSRQFACRLVEQVRSCPHLWVEHERSRPSQITIVALTGLDHWKRVHLPEDFPQADWEDQVELIECFWEYWLNEHSLRCPLFGRVTGFFYRPNPWSCYRFTARGRLCSGDLGAWQEPVAQWQV